MTGTKKVQISRKKGIVPPPEITQDALKRKDSKLGGGGEGGV